jgi:protein TonB
MKNTRETSMSQELEATREPVRWLGNRNIIVPPEIVPVPRVSPIRSRKRTPCRAADGVPVCRAGSREWFSDHVFADVETETRDLRAACGTSIAAHGACLIGLVVLLASQSALTTPARVGEPMRMPAFVAIMGGGAGAGANRVASPAPLAAPSEGREQPPVKKRAAEATHARPPQPPPPVPAAMPPEIAPASEPFEGPAQAHTEGAEDTSARPPDGAAGGVGDAGGGAGAGSGSGNGGGHGVGDGSGIGASRGPYRLGEGIEAPKKIKDVAPIYPSGAMAMRAIGTVVIEAIVGIDGKVREAKVIHSIAQLDQAALEAVRQWEFAPARLNGAAVAAIVNILVTFSIY